MTDTQNRASLWEHKLANLYEHNFEYELNEDGNSYFIKRYRCFNSLYGFLAIIPAEYNGKPVTKIGRCAFYDFDTLKCVIIPNSITAIEDMAFYCCRGLEEVIIPTDSKIHSIGNSVFAYCKNLKNFIMPDSVINLGMSVFEDCESLECVKLSNNISKIDIETFEGCKKLDHFTIPNSVTVIEAGSFRKTNIKMIGIPEGVKVIGNQYFSVAAFDDCQNLTFIKIPDSIEKIYAETFKGCNHLNKISVPNTTILDGVELPDGCKIIDRSTLNEVKTKL